MRDAIGTQRTIEQIPCATRPGGIGADNFGGINEACDDLHAGEILGRPILGY